MEFAVKRFARNILLLHLVLLVGVLGIVFMASRAIRERARDQAQSQAEIRQRMLASQTARGIEAFYKSIVSDMDLVPRQDDSESERTKVGSILREVSREFSFPLLGPTTLPTFPIDLNRPRSDGPNREGPEQRPNVANGRPPQAGGGGFGANRPRQPAGRSMLVGQILGRQLEERVTHLFVVTRPPVKAGAKSPAVRRTVETVGHDPFRELAVRDVVVEPKKGEGPTAADLADRFHDWLANVHVQAVSPFELVDGKGYNLVALPISNGASVLVAAVPVSTITEMFLAALNADPANPVMLVNSELMIMASSRSKLVGQSVDDGGDADFKSALQAFKAGGFKASHRVDHAYQVGEQRFDASLLTAEPMEVAGRKWFIVVGSPLSQVDAVVSQLFGGILRWAVFVVVVITGILVSTSVQLIRSRVRVERLRTQVLRTELDRARQIQQAWLPRHPPDSRSLDVAAANFPAHHISGDFYNWFDLPDGRIAIVIGDVTGHGMSAAFLMATTQLLVRTTMQRISDPAACLAEVNRQLCTLVFNGQFVTLQILVTDPAGGPVEVSSAGHPAPLLAEDGTFRPLPVESGLVLGVDPDTDYETVSVDLPTDGATLLLYTDGATDILAPNGKRLGNDGLLKACPAARPGPARRGDAQADLDSVVATLNHFRGSRELADDLTFVAVRIAASARAERNALVGAV